MSLNDEPRRDVSHGLALTKIQVCRPLIHGPVVRGIPSGACVLFTLLKGYFRTTLTSATLASGMSFDAIVYRGTHLSDIYKKLLTCPDSPVTALIRHFE